MFSGPAFALGCLVALAASRVPFVKGTIYILLTIWTCWLGQICALCFLYPAFFIFPKIHKFFQRMMLSLWFSFNTFLMEKLIGINFVFYGDDIQDNGDYTSLAISNHHTAIDWLFLWVFFGRLRTLGNLKIVLKNELKFVPFFGWIMQVCRHAISPFLFSFFLPINSWHTRPSECRAIRQCIVCHPDTRRTDSYFCLEKQRRTKNTSKRSVLPIACWKSYTIHVCIFVTVVQNFGAGQNRSHHPTLPRG